MHRYSYPADDLPLMVDLTRRTVNCAEHHWWYWPRFKSRGWCNRSWGGGGVQVGVHWTSTVALNIDDDASPDWEAGDGAHTRRGVHGILELTTGCVCQLVCGEPAQLHLTLMMVLARIGKRGMVRTLVGECTASLSWPQGVCVWVVCGEPVQLHLTSMMVLAQIGKRGMVRTLVGECTASLSWPWGELVCREPAMTAPPLCSLCTGRGCWQDMYGNWSYSVWWLSEDVRCLHGYWWMVGGVMRVTGNAMPFLRPFTVYENGLLTKKGCDRWPWMATPFQWTFSVCVCKTVWTRLVVNNDSSRQHNFSKHLWCTWSLQDIYKWFLNGFWWWHLFTEYSLCAWVIVTVRRCLVISDGNTVSLDIHCVLGVIATVRHAGLWDIVAGDLWWRHCFTV